MFENITVIQRIIGKRHRGNDDSLMATSMCDVRNCETSQVDLTKDTFFMYVKFVLLLLGLCRLHNRRSSSL